MIRGTFRPKTADSRDLETLLVVVALVPTAGTAWCAPAAASSRDNHGGLVLPVHLNNADF
eukprot:3727665-Alexandrium_andersonii.AAC.1